MERPVKLEDLGMIYKATANSLRRRMFLMECVTLDSTKHGQT